MNEISDDQNGMVRKSTQIPADLGKFRTWADRECVNWPSELQIKAYEVCLGKRPIEDFIGAWSFWGIQSEKGEQWLPPDR